MPARTQRHADHNVLPTLDRFGYLREPHGRCINKKRSAKVMAQPNIQGRFFWQELLCADPAAVTAFYGRVLGWRAQPAASDPSYMTFASRSGPVAGAMAPGAEQKDTHSHWLAYIGAEDVDATLATAVRLGGKLVHAAADIEQGRYAVLADPQGATFGVYKPSHIAADHAVQPGDHCWLELATTDLETAFKFYQEVFGWQVIQRLDMGASGTYLIFGVAGTPRGGVMKLMHPAPGPYWLCYTEVADLDKAIAAAEKSGGRLLNGPMTVPGGARIAQLADPNGAVFALHTQVKIPAIQPQAPAASTTSPSSAKSPASASPAPPAAALRKVPLAKVPTLEAAKAIPKPAAATPAAAPSAPAKAASKPAAKKAAVKPRRRSRRRRSRRKRSLRRHRLAAAPPPAPSAAPAACRRKRRGAKSSRWPSLAGAAKAALA
ncbi:MAG: VOC family protein [Steroidobacteraceae bacterium]